MKIIYSAKVVFFGILASVSLLAITLAQPALEEEAVKKAYESYVQSWKAKDLAALEQELSPDYMAVNFDGKVSTKENEIATAKTDIDWQVMTVDEIHGRVWGSAAIATGFISAQGTKPDGSRLSTRVRFLAALVKQNNRWQLVATQSASAKKQ